MIWPMARSPSTSPPPSPSIGKPRPKRSGRGPLWPRSASISLLRLGVLIGGLIIIADLSAQALTQRTPSAEDAAVIAEIDDLINYVLFALLGVLVVRDTGLIYAGALAGLFAAILDDIVVTAAGLLAPQPTPLDTVKLIVAENLVVGTVFAGLSGVVYALVQRWSAGGRRPR
jgi:hypothetical protein